jgi:UDP-N-acetylmuramoyl-tripeptide--D-alanyl-D-alanine ligase
MAFRLVAGADAIEATIPTLGRLSVHNALAGAAVGLAAGLDLPTIAGALAGGWSAPHRGVLVDAGGVTIVDDSYNASPASVQAALELIGGFPGRHVAVLGEMKELGSGHDEGHRIAGEAAARGAELVVVVDGEPGGPARGIVEGTEATGGAEVIAVADREAALAVLMDRLRPGDVVLVKASRGVELDLLVDALVARLGGAEAGTR